MLTITVSGPMGSGRSTLMAIITQALVAADIHVSTIDEGAFRDDALSLIANQDALAQRIDRVKRRHGYPGGRAVEVNVHTDFASPPVTKSLSS